MNAIEENPRPEEEIATWFIDEEDGQEYEGPVEETIHEKMYQMAIKNGGSWLGGSENLGGSEKRLEEEFTPENDPYGGY